MKTRSISSVAFVVVVVGFFLLRQFVYAPLFNILIWFFIAVATFELARALKGFCADGNFYPAVVYGILFAPLYALLRYVVKTDLTWLYMLVFAFVGVAFAFVLCMVKKCLNKFAATFLPYVYPALLMLTLLLAGDLEEPKGFLAVLTVFVISPCADSLAYLVGMVYNKIRKGQAKKLCPRLSPKKTWAGAIGGVIGSVLGAMLVCLIFNGKVAEIQNSLADSARFSLPYLHFAGIGFLGAILTEIGDLFESFIKRRVGIKDMGKIMPGHGGIMDRIDGMSFAAVAVFVWFLLI